MGYQKFKLTRKIYYDYSGSNSFFGDEGTLTEIDLAMANADMVVDKADNFRIYAQDADFNEDKKPSGFLTKQKATNLLQAQ